MTIVLWIGLYVIVGPRALESTFATTTSGSSTGTAMKIGLSFYVDRRRISQNDSVS